jgi:hypothetical protein
MHASGAFRAILIVSTLQTAGVDLGLAETAAGKRHEKAENDG